MKGIILAGGSGTRLYPITKGISKQLMPVYNKPMIYYPLTVLMMAGIKDILVITTKESQADFKELLRDGSDLGINITYVIQEQPNGLAEAFLLGEEFIGDDACAMVLGDNVFYGSDFKEKLESASKNAINGKATIFGIKALDPTQFGVMEIDEDNKVLSIEEKPSIPKSNWIVTGLYFYPSGVSNMAKKVNMSKRGELEITELNNLYLEENILQAELLDKDYVWFDTGTFDGLLATTNFISEFENDNQKMIGCPEEIAFRNGWISKEKIEEFISIYSKNSYGEYLEKVLKNKD